MFCRRIHNEAKRKNTRSRLCTQSDLKDSSSFDKVARWEPAVMKECTADGPVHKLQEHDRHGETTSCRRRRCQDCTDLRSQKTGQTKPKHQMNQPTGTPETYPESCPRKQKTRTRNTSGGLARSSFTHRGTSAARGAVPFAPPSCWQSPGRRLRARTRGRMSTHRGPVSALSRHGCEDCKAE